MSRYVFLLRIECLISLFRVAEANDKIIGIRVHRGAPSINHLLFVEDRKLFCKSTLQVNTKIQKLLEQNKRASCKKSTKRRLVWSLV